MKNINKQKNIDTVTDNKNTLAGNAIMEEIKRSYQTSKSIKVKQVLGRILSSKIVKKYRLLSYVRKSIAPIIPSRIPQTEKLLQFVKKTKAQSNFIKFNLISQHLLSFYPQIDKITYNFFAAGHGKSPADGIGGTLKRIADDEVKRGEDMSDFSTLMSALKRKVKNIHISQVDLKTIEEIDSLLPDKIPNFVGTRKVHQCSWKKENASVIHFNFLSCASCSPGNICSHYFQGSLNFLSNKKSGSRKRKSETTSSNSKEATTSNTKETTKNTCLKIFI